MREWNGNFTHISLLPAASNDEVPGRGLLERQTGQSSDSSLHGRGVSAGGPWDRDQVCGNGLSALPETIPDSI